MMIPIWAFNFNSQAGFKISNTAYALRGLEKYSHQRIRYKMLLNVEVCKHAYINK